MSDFDAALKSYLQSANAGNEKALGHLLDHFRPELRALAQRNINPVLNARIDDSDIVQQSCLSAYQAFEEFEGDDVAQFAAWLKQIHNRNIQNVIRDNQVAGIRDVKREQGKGSIVAKTSRTPSRIAMKEERKKNIEQCLDQILPDQREAIRMRYIDGLSLSEIVEEMGRSESSVAGLLKRGLSQLRDIMRESRS